MHEYMLILRFKMLKTIFNNYKIGNFIIKNHLFLLPGRLITAKRFSTNSVSFYSISVESNLNDNKSESDIEQEKKLKIIQLEVDIARQEGRKVPELDFFKPDHWDHLLSLGSRTARSRYYLFLWQIEKKKESRQLKKIERAAGLLERQTKERQEVAENNHIIYGIGHTTLFLRFYDSTVNHWHNNKLIRAMQFGQKIILDCSYDSHMNRSEQTNTAKQLMLCFAENRINDEPFDMHLCNVNYDSFTMKYLEKHIPTMRNPEFPMNTTEKCFTEIFPKDKIVYLTPHCRNNLNYFNPDDIYVIGGLVDKTNNEPLSLAKAKKMNLRMARLPLDTHLCWSSGSGKSLTLNQMISILLDIKKSNDWNYALRHVPKRKLYDPTEEDKYKKHKDKNFKIQSKRMDFDIDKWGKKNRNKFSN